MKAKAKKDKRPRGAAREKKLNERTKIVMEFSEPKAVEDPTWKSYPQLTEAGLYVTRNGEGFDVVRVQKIEDGLRVFYNIIGANRPQNLHADLVANSVYQKIKE